MDDPERIRRRFTKTELRRGRATPRADPDNESEDGDEFPEDTLFDVTDDPSAGQEKGKP